MKKIVLFFKRIRKYYRTRKTSHDVKDFYKKNKHRKIEFTKNIWSNNNLWDFYIQSLPHSIKSSHYVPFDYYGYKIESAFNDDYTTIYVKDKNMYDKIFSSSKVSLPTTVFRCMNNLFMDSDYKTIANINEFVSNINQDVIIKQPDSRGGGVGIEKYVYSTNGLVNSENNDIFDIGKIRKRYRGNFIVQEIVKQHPELGKYHPFSLNTIKVFTYRSVKTNQVHVLTGHIRIGVNKSFLDNLSIDGVGVGLKINEFNNAVLREYGIDKYGNFSKYHPDTKIEYKDNEIPNFPIIVESIEELSNLIPYQRLIGWDFSIDEQGKPVLVELNVRSGIWAMQVANGEPLFGKFTEEIKEYLDTNKSSFLP